MGPLIGSRSHTVAVDQQHLQILIARTFCASAGPKITQSFYEAYSEVAWEETGGQDGRETVNGKEQDSLDQMALMVG